MIIMMVLIMVMMMMMVMICDDDGDDDDDDAKCVFTGITLHSKIPHIYPTNLSICHSRFPRFEFPNGSMQFPGCARTVPPAGLTAEA